MKTWNRENDYQMYLKKELQKRLPESLVIKLDPNDIQGIPDLIILNKNKWGTLEVKKSENESHRPNQDYYVGLMNRLSFSSFIFPENEKEVLDALEQSLKS